jgi:flagellar basal-body rod protein FlgG
MIYPNQKQAGDVMQGFVESSNVNIVDQMMKLVLNQRNFKISTKAFLVSDAIMKAGSS